MPEQDQPPPVRVHVRYPVPPPIFDNKTSKDADLHWILFLDYVQETEVAAEDQVAKFRITLNEYPRRWYNIHRAEFADLNTLERLFKAKFQPVTSRAEALKEFQSLAIRPNESLSAYKERATIVASKASIEDDELVTAQFISGLPPSIRSVVRAHQDKTLDAATMTAQAACVDGPSPNAHGAVLSLQTDTDTELCDDMHALYVTRREFSPRRPRSTFTRQRDYTSHDRAARPSSRDNRRDIRDGRRDYRSRDDRSSSRSQSRDRAFRRPRDHTPRGEYKSPNRDRKVSFRPRSKSPLTCKFCQRRGHTIGDCHLLHKALEDGSIKCHKDF